MTLIESKTSANSFKQFNKRSAAALEYSASSPGGKNFIAIIRIFVGHD